MHIGKSVQESLDGAFVQCFRTLIYLEDFLVALHIVTADGERNHELDAIGLAEALRVTLIEVAKAKTSAEGKSSKMEMLYEYLSGPEFRQQIEGIVEAFVSMKKDLDAEKRAMEKIWAKREKQIERVVKNTGRMYGSLQGIVGSTLPELESLELKALEGE